MKGYLHANIGQNQHYGCHLGPVPIPLSESLGRLDKSGTNFYYEQEDILFELAENRSWSYNIVRPHAIVGYAPGGEWKLPAPYSGYARPDGQRHAEGSQLEKKEVQVTTDILISTQKQVECRKQ